MNARVRVGDHEVSYNKEGTRWLGVWLDDKLTLNDHTTKTLAKATRTQNRVRSWIGKEGFSSQGC